MEKRYFKTIVYSLALLILFSCNQKRSINDIGAKVSFPDKTSEPSTITIPLAKEIIVNQQSRVRDAYGSGQYGSSRDAGERTHNGIDIIVKPNEKVFSPIKGTITRQVMPYKNDPNFKGIVIKGLEEWEGFELKIFYVEGLLSGEVSESQHIGDAQDLTVKYPGITNHIHFEAKFLDTQIDPFTLWQYSF